MQLHPRNTRARRDQVDGVRPTERADRIASCGIPSRIHAEWLELISKNRARRDRLVAAVRRFGLSFFKAAPLTCIIVAINLIIHIGVAMGGALAVDALWDIGAVSGAHAAEVWRLFTSGWIHADFEHVIDNMIALIVVGRLLEPTVGSRRFAMIYVIALLCSSLAGLCCYFDSRSAGASGAICGIMGAALATPVCTRLSRAIVSWLFLAAYTAWCMSGDPGPGIAVASHIVGMAVGVLCGILSGPGAHPARAEPPPALVFEGYSESLRAAVRIPRFATRR